MGDIVPNSPTVQSSNLSPLHPSQPVTGQIKDSLGKGQCRDEQQKHVQHALKRAFGKASDETGTQLPATITPELVASAAITTAVGSINQYCAVTTVSPVLGGRTSAVQA